MAVRMRTPGYYLAVLALCASLSRAATVRGQVKDSQGRPAAAADVSLRRQPDGPALTTRTDAQGAYSFAALDAGTYSLRAQADGALEALAGPFALGGTESRQVDLTLQSAFFDQPDFIVAGVTDAMSRGGHGSDTVLRSAEALAKATASLSGKSAAEAAAEKSLREAIARDPANPRPHHQLADLEETAGNALEAVREYQRAAELDAGEANLFDWGAELLKHRAAEPAAGVFARGNRAFPHSLRMLLGLAAAWYALGSYDEAARRFFEACDMAPTDPQPYMFLGKVRSIEITQLQGYADRMGRFAASHPGNAWANYYYALSLWKQRRDPEDAETPKRVQELLEKAVRIDPLLGAAYLQLGILYSGRNDYAAAIAAYRKAIGANPPLEEAHYRLGLIYARIGEKEKAKQELDIYERMSKISAAAAERERAEIRQFVIELHRGGPAPPVR